MCPARRTEIQLLAQELNRQIEAAAPEVLEMRSAYGRRLYFPRGILSQSAEAKQKAPRFNATIGIATADGGPMYLPAIQQHLADLEPKDVYPYAPAAGRPELRRLWREKLMRENPDLAGKQFGQPIVTSAITHGLALIGALFVDPGDVLVLPDKLWGNYRLNFEVNFRAQIETFPFYRDGGFNVEGFAQALADAATRREKPAALPNCTNKRTCYVPSAAAGEALPRGGPHRRRRRRRGGANARRLRRTPAC